MTRRAPRTSFPPDPRSPGFRDWLYSLWQQVSRAGQILISQLSTSEVTANQVLASNAANTSIVGKTMVGTTPVTVTHTSANITVAHANSGITADTYGSASNVPVLMVNVTGHLTSVANTPISITASAVSDFNEAAQDAVGTILTASGNVPLTYSDSTPSITADLSNTGVSASTYGSASAVPVVTVDVKGRLTGVSNTAISITSGAVTDFTEAAQDAVGGILTASGNVPLTYDDAGGTITATLSNTGVGASNYGNATHSANITVDVKGRITAVSNTAISVASSAITDFTEAAQDAVGNMVVGTGNVQLTYTDATPALSGELSDTGVSAATYGNASQVPQITVDAKGRITSVSNVAVTATLGNSGVTAGLYGDATRVGQFNVSATGVILSASNVSIAITSANVSDFTEAAQDAVGAMVVGTGNVPLTYVDGTPSLTATLSTTGVTAGTYGNASRVANFTVDAAGRISAASNVTINLPLSQLVPGTNNQLIRMTSGNWGNVSLVAGGNVTITQNTNNITISASVSGGSTAPQMNISTQTNNYSALASDHWTLIQMSNSAVKTFNLPANNSAAIGNGSVLTVQRLGTGNVMILPANGVTLNTATGPYISPQYGVASLVKTGTDIWALYGDVSAGANEAIFGGGFTSTYAAIVDLYFYADDTAIPISALSVARYGLGAGSISTKACFAGGYDTANVTTNDLYTYASHTRSSGDALDTAKREFGVTTSATVSYFAGGNAPGGTDEVQKYTFSTDTISAGSVLGDGYRLYCAGLGSATIGYFVAGTAFAGNYTTEKYTYSGDTTAAGSDIDLTRAQAGGGSKSTLGIVACRDGAATYTSTSKYTFSGDTTAAATALPKGIARNGGASSSTKLILAGIDEDSFGTGGATTSTTQQYTYSGDTTATGGSVLQGRRNAQSCGTSNCHGGL